MLHNIPEAINRMTRNIVINHPNSYEAVVARKVINRVGDEMIGGLPTLGGLAVISSDDEEDISWEILGNAYAKPVNGFENAPMMDRQDANNGGINEYLFLIEPEVQDGMPGGFSIKKGDVVYLIMNDSIRLAYEVMRPQTAGNIAPYQLQYVCNRRDDLHMAI